jgi:GNAT superfamily N-acetyltransferase
MGEHYRLSSEVVGRHIDELQALYQKEWWSRGRTRDDISVMLRHSDFCFAWHETGTERLIAFARVLSDRVYKALILDVIVDGAHRGSGLGRQIMESIAGHPELRNVRHLELYCRPEMVPFYEKWGFSTDVGGACFMRRVNSRA